MKIKYFISFLLTVNVIIAYSQANDTGFEQFAIRQDSLLTSAYNHKDTAAYEKLVTILLSRYNQLPVAGKEKFSENVANAYYNFGCIYCVSGNKTMALVYLKKSVAAGFKGYSTLLADLDYESIQEEEAFTTILKGIRNNLRQYIKTPVSDRLKMDALDELGTAYRDVDNDSMVFYAQQIVLLTKKGKTTLSAHDECYGLLLLGAALLYVANYPDAKEACLKTLETSERKGDTLIEGLAYKYLGMISRNTNDFRQAINYLTVSKSIGAKASDKRILFQALMESGKTYEQMGILDSAFTDEQAALALLFSLSQGKRSYSDGEPQQNMAGIYSRMGNKKLAEEFFRQSFDMNFKINKILLLAKGYCSFAEHFDRFNQHDSAIYYATKASAIDSKYNLYVQQLAASTLLTRLYKDNNNIDSAFKYQTLMIQTKDKIFSTEKITRLQTLELNEQIRQQETASERKENIQYALIALGLVTFITFFLLLSRSFISNQKLISFFGVIGLLLVFEFLNLLLHPFLERITHHSPLLMLLSLACIAAILIPLHHRLESRIMNKLIEKNKAVRLAKAKKTIEKLAADADKSNI